jgi:hypothetical protein
VPKPNRIGHSIGHQVKKLLADGNSKLAIIRIVANRATNGRPNGGERLIHYCKRLRIVHVESGVFEKPLARSAFVAGESLMLSATWCLLLLLPDDSSPCAFQMTIAS